MSPYQLQPRRPFSVDKVRKASREVLEEFLDGVEYDPGACSALAGTIAATLRDRVKALNFDRYKIVVFCCICQNAMQGLNCATRGLWEVSLDRCSHHVYESPSLTALACVHGIYVD